MYHAAKTITSTELVRNLSGMIDQVRISGRPLLIKKGRQTIAEIHPPSKVGFPLSKLGQLLESLPKLGDEKHSMSRDLEVVRRKAVLPRNPWA